MRWLVECGLVDLEFKGAKFTWRNNRREDQFIMERIDMAFANPKWRELHDQTMVFVEVAVGSNHNLLTLNTYVPLEKVGKPFRFESFWVTDEDCSNVIDARSCTHAKIVSKNGAVRNLGISGFK